jgi:hypothetical protein
VQIFHHDVAKLPFNDISSDRSGVGRIYGSVGELVLLERGDRQIRDIVAAAKKAGIQGQVSPHWAWRC